MTAVPLLADREETRASRLLVPWALAQGGLGLVALVVAASLYPIRPSIALDIGWIPASLRLAAGVVAWILFGLVGGTRARPRPGGSVHTFSMPFIVAGTLLGGPVVGGLMGFLSEWELRELRSTPWYGTLANHGVAAASAVAAGVIALAAQVMLTALLPGQTAGVFAITAGLAAFIFATLNVALVVPTLALHEGVGLLEASRSYDASFRGISMAEGVLAWLMAVTFVAVGWWAPVLSVVLVLAVWQAYDRAERLAHDPMTGLLNDVGFTPLFAEVHQAARRGRRAYALLVVDLDSFKAANDTYGMSIGDEVIRVVARRINAVVRATDLVVRFNRAGDEFGVVLVGVADRSVALMLAERIRSTIGRPIHIRDRDIRIEVGATIGIALGELRTDLSADEVKDRADLRMHSVKRTEPGSIGLADA